MRVYLMTDLEGVAGVENSEDWCVPTGTHYQRGCELLTHEVNAAIRGFRRAGATRVRVADGHGWGGIDRTLLSPDAEYFRGQFPDPYPFGLDDGFDVIGWIGQHAKAGTTGSHLPHTGSFNVVEYCINGAAVGEFEQIARCAQLFGVTPILAAGDEALTIEAQTAFPDIRTVAVKRGLGQESGSDIATADEYSRVNSAAQHRPVAWVHRQLEESAYEALRQHSAGTAPPNAGPSNTQKWTRRVQLREHGPGTNVIVSADYPDLITLLNDLIE